MSAGKGKSAVAATIPRRREADKRVGRTDPTIQRKAALFIHEIIAAPYPPSFSDRSHSMEQRGAKSKNRITHSLRREIEIALPVELSREEQDPALVREYCSSRICTKGIAPTSNIHDTATAAIRASYPFDYAPLDEKEGTWAAKSKRNMSLIENGERRPLPSGRYKRRARLTLWTGTGRRTPTYGARRRLTFQRLFRSEAAARSVSNHRDHAEAWY